VGLSSASLEETHNHGAQVKRHNIYAKQGSSLP
jgi:hypothetical protein